MNTEQFPRLRPLVKITKWAHAECMSSQGMRVLAAAALTGLAVTTAFVTAPAGAATTPGTVRTVVVTSSATSVFGISSTGKVALSAASVVPASTTLAKVRAALVAVLQIPVAQDRNFGIRTAIPAATIIRSYSVSGSVATADLSAAFTSGSATSLRQRTAQVVYSLTAVPGISKVAFRINHKLVSRIGANGPYVAGGISRAAMVSSSPAVLVTSTRPGTHVTSPFKVSGVATTFEAVVHWKLVTLSGKVITRGTAMATNSYRGNFTITVKTSYHGSAHLVVGADAPQGNVDMVEPVATPLYIH
jgi:spore germination protein GerM